MRLLKLGTFAGLAVISLTVSSLGGATKVAAAPLSGCPSGSDWNLWAVDDVLDFLGLGEAPASMDPNGDGWTCVKFQELANGRKGWTAVIFRDNVAP